MLEKTSKYNNMLTTRKTIDSIFKNMAITHDLKNISKNGTYDYTDVISNIVRQNECTFENQKKVKEKIYAMTYAYISHHL